MRTAVTNDLTATLSQPDSVTTTEDEDSEGDVSEESQNIMVSIIKKESDSWPKKRTYANLKKFIELGRFKVGHNGESTDTD